MDLEKINNEYLQFKSNLETLKKEKETLGKQVQKAKNDLLILQASKANAEIDDDKIKAQLAQDAIDVKKDDIKRLEKELVEKKAKMVEVQMSIEERVAEVKNNPELKGHMNEVLSKKYARKIKAIKEEKNEIGSKKERYIKIGELATNHETAKKNIIGMTNAQKEIKALQAELDSLANLPVGGVVTYKDPVRANDIMTKFLPIANGKYNKNKDLFMKVAKSHNIDVQESDLQDLTGVLAENKGNINIQGTVDRQVKGFNKQIKSYSVQIMNFTDKINEISKSNEKAANEATQETQQQANDNDTFHRVNPDDIPFATPVKTGFFSRLFEKFRAWRDRSNQRALDIGTDIDKPDDTATPVAPAAPAQPQLPLNDKDKKKNDFAQSLKYDIVKDNINETYTKVETKAREDGIKAGRKAVKPEADIDRD